MNVRFLRGWRALASIGVSMAMFGSVARAGAQTQSMSPQERQWELQIGQQAYAQYQQRGEIVPAQSPMYRDVDSIGNAIAAVANPDYFAPFHFVLLNEPQPNAFSMPGGNVYITTGMMSYLHSRDELAGVLCHEVNHSIHHDMYVINQAAHGGNQPIAMERAAEFNADRGGAYTCAKAGFNPWGMVWNFRQHGSMEGSSQGSPTADHPSDQQRMASLTALFASDSATFGKFRDDIALSPALSSSATAYQPYPGRQQYPGPQYPYQQPYPSPQYSQQYPSPQQYQPQYPQQQQQMTPPYPPPPLPPCYPGC
jgi:predicted Zn-dependent protease